MNAKHRFENFIISSIVDLFFDFNKNSKVNIVDLKQSIKYKLHSSKGRESIVRMLKKYLENCRDLKIKDKVNEIFNLMILLYEDVKGVV